MTKHRHVQNLNTSPRKLWMGALVVAALVLVLVGCFPGGITSRDFSSFQSYQFKQTPGLGFCGDKDRVFSAELTRDDAGAMTFAHSVLVNVGPDPEQCEDGVAAEGGCFRPKAQPARTLNAQEADQVIAAFAEVKYFRQPDKMCRDIAFDPCVIERHDWDGKELSDYFCGADRLGDDQRRDIRALLSDLQAGG